LERQLATTLEEAPRRYAEKHLAQKGAWEIGRHEEVAA
jgi:hypothetical protein